MEGVAEVDGHSPAGTAASAQRCLAEREAKEPQEKGILFTVHNDPLYPLQPRHVMETLIISITGWLARLEGSS